MGFTVVHQLLRLGRGTKLDDLLDQLRPLPGHRVRLLNFVEEERARAHVDREHAAALPQLAPTSVAPARRAASSARVPSHANNGASIYRAAANGSSRSGAGAANPRGMPSGKARGAPSVVTKGTATKVAATTRSHTTAAEATAAAVAAAGLAAVVSGSRRASQKGKDEDEAEALAVLRASWAREMLSAVKEDCHEGSAELVDTAEVAAAAAAVRAQAASWREEASAQCTATTSLRNTVQYEDDFEEEGDEDEDEAAYGDASDKENADDAMPHDARSGAHDDDLAAVKTAMQRQLNGSVALAPPPATPSPSASDAAAILPPLQRSLTPRGATGGVDATSELALRHGKLNQSPISTTPFTQPRPKQRRSMLANSVDTHASPKGLLWEPDRKEVYTSVAFVLQKHIELQGRYLLVRTPQPMDATLSKPADHGSHLGSAGGFSDSDDELEPTVPPSARGEGLSRLAAIATEAADSVADEDEGEGVTPLPLHPLQSQQGGGAPLGATSPDMPASVRNSFISGARSMHGLRYSLELSPVVEAKAEGGRRHSRRPSLETEEAMPMGGKFGRGGVVGCGQSQWADAEWAQDDDEQNHGSMYAGDDADDDADSADADSGGWDGWQPAAEDFRLFDETQTHIRRADGTTPSLLVDAKVAEQPPSYHEVSNYIRALCQSARMGAEASVVALAYIERLVSAAGFPLHGGTWRRCCLSAWLLASKMWDDECLESPQYAQLFGYCADDLNALEQRFVEAIGYRLGLSSAEYARYYYSLRSICQTTTEAFPLRPLDAELEQKLERKATFVNGGFRDERWDRVLDAADLSRSM